MKGLLILSIFLENFLILLSFGIWFFFSVLWLFVILCERFLLRELKIQLFWLLILLNFITYPLLQYLFKKFSKLKGKLFSSIILNKSLSISTDISFSLSMVSQTLFKQLKSSPYVISSKICFNSIIYGQVLGSDKFSSESHIP